MSETPTQLLPCPFCGGIAETDASRSYREITRGQLGQAFAIYCLSCSADMTFCHVDYDGLNAVKIETLAVEQWNTRAPDAERDTLRVKLHNALSNHALQLKRTNETYRALQKTEAELGERNIAYDAIEAELQLRKDQLERAYADLAEARALIKKTAHVLARAFDRIHCLPRTSDTELANEISATIAALAKEQPR